MREPPPTPWIRFPDLLRDRHPTAEAQTQLAEWYAFLLELSPDELLQYEQDYPPPPEWEVFYRHSEGRHDVIKKLPGVMQHVSLIEKMWQATTLK